MLTKTTKNLFVGEEVCKSLDGVLEDLFIDQLLDDSLESKEKEEIANRLKEHLNDCKEKSIDDSKFWYKYGKRVGELSGMLKATGALTVGFVIGALLRK